jgi:hypothetical protein
VETSKALSKGVGLYACDGSELVPVPVPVSVPVLVPVPVHVPVKAVSRKKASSFSSYSRH